MGLFVNNVLYVAVVPSIFWSPAEKGLTSLLFVLYVFLCFCQFFIWYPTSGVVFDCINF